MFKFLASLFGKKKVEVTAHASLPPWEEIIETMFYPVNIRAREVTIDSRIADVIGLAVGDGFSWEVREGQVHFTRSLPGSGIKLRPERKGSTTLVIGNKWLAEDLAQYGIRKGKTHMYRTKDADSFIIKV